MLNIIVYILEIILLVIIGLNVAYVTFFVLLSIFYKQTNFAKIKIHKFNSFVIIIPAYKSDDILFETVKYALNQNYRQPYDIVLVGDNLQTETIDKLNTLPIKFFAVNFEYGSKAKSLNYALSKLTDNYDYCILLDVDNIIKPDFLNKINARLQHNEIIVQGHRTAKNLNSSFAILDGISEEINNIIFRKGHVVIGLSAALVGSGKAINYQYFKNAMLNISSSVEDKELEMALAKDKIMVHYEEDALIFDEKVFSADIFRTQRKRWISSQFFNANNVIVSGLKHFILHGNFNLLDKALQRVLLPRIVLLGIVFLMALTVFIPFFSFGNLFFSLFLICLVSYLLALPSKYFNKHTLLACFQIPRAFFLIFLAIFKSKDASKIFTATPKVFKATK